ncbi:acyl--CoA ligase [Aquibium sp. A9E412]|uniref:class I adenylate-forming enzyme family protein n=1 Tax=Aquibium sp. A9E412 TaxID=2976767 RepID=UPI0025AF1F48|nr:class I adenylate-forming enzyme family protein [Aquibium sp. A9E412]MDN2565611.1 acyl--CoA ligase [Aquibium sp. A9E412]
MPTTELGTLPAWLALHRRERADAIALCGDGEAVSYRQLADDTQRLAAGLARAGIGKGDVVAAQLANTRAFVTAFLASATLGAVFQTLHMPYRQKELRYLLEHSGARAVFAVSTGAADAPVHEMLRLRDALASLDTVIAVGAPVAGATSYDALFDTPPETRFPAADPQTTYLLLYTSGTTAEPKGVPHSAEAFLGNAHRSAAELGITADSRILSLAAFSHLYGLFTIHLALAAGATICLLPAYRPPALPDDLARLRPTHVFAAPAHFAPVVADGGLTAAHTRTIEVACLSGTTVPPSLARALDGLLENGVVIQLWGMSELQAGTFGRPDDPLDTRLATAGRASPRTELRVVTDAAEPVAPGAEGQLEVRGPSVFAGYLGNREASEASFRSDGWFRTGDLARISAEGFLTLTGRTKEIINRGGVKYNPIEVELVALGHPAVLQCAVVPYPDPVLGERACLCVEARPDAAIGLDEVCAMLEERGIAKFKWPERLEIFEQLPLTPTRKVMRGALAEMLKARS